MKKFIALILLFQSISCAIVSTQNQKSNDHDEFLGLEDIEGAQSMGWVNEQNQKSFGVLKNDSRYVETHTDIEKILGNQDRIPTPTITGHTIYNHWTDDKNPRGLWRRCSFQEYQKKNPNWEIVLDVDQLGKDEKESWVFKGANFLVPDYKRALVRLSRGGKDAIEIREFDLEKKEFVKDGFFLPESKSGLTWIDRDTVLVSTDFGPGTMTSSGYPRIVKSWRRGEHVSSAKLVYEGKPDDMGVNTYNVFRPEKNFIFISRSINFYEYETFYYSSQGELVRLPLPSKSYISGVYNDDIYFLLNEDLENQGLKFTTGSLVKMSLSEFLKKQKVKITLVFKPDSRSSFSGITVTKSKVWLEISKNVKPSVFELKRTGKLVRVQLPEIGTASIISASELSDEIFVGYSSFLTPSTQFLLKENQLIKSKSLPEQFNTRGLVIEQFESTSKDGTKIPYFLIRKKDLPYDSKNPTLLYGYGGFQVSMDPYYSPILGKTWLEKGGVYALANIRGGGEFGPKWHQSALKENRQRAFDDFYSVAEDLIRRKITSSEKLAIKGGSNGGLLMGVSFTQRPELFKTVICEVPLLDMLRFHKLLAGASWMAEYGNPEIPEERTYIKKYSPYQNVHTNKKYPKVFFMTSTKDDRVHPGHARKMAALFEKNNLPYLYYENTEGGHGAAADLKQRAQYQALQTVFLMRELMN